MIDSIYSKSDNMKRKYIMNDLMKELIGKVIRVINKKLFHIHDWIRSS